MLLVCGFTVGPEQREGFVRRAEHALRLLTAQPGCVRAALGQATEAADRWVLTAEFASVVAYRRALSPFEVREHVVPLLAEALTDQPAAYETVLSASAGAVREQPSLLAADADTVRRDQAGGPAAPRR
ncbi:antibiotic biosynthesis monooxygenase family protein [Goodfellowiella coeruleoviolacea]|uniref:Antibiotic biosynthesis monooxygenase n=1 Tax=Goodfellowiella coeruleoviolacea TaxID=334858 RepID=A0AAE3GDD9_9PSEU|nr:antibiotic biosynthesis monooxygenase family protein [Goodfellowiella coeruleoviolacea]MCP2165192.1 Antibiotic biosynthesis monooxygenase [Goodfellowiella coeruleoviolacea]